MNRSGDLLRVVQVHYVQVIVGSCKIIRTPCIASKLIQNIPPIKF